MINIIVEFIMNKIGKFRDSFKSSKKIKNKKAEKNINQDVIRRQVEKCAIESGFIQISKEMQLALSIDYYDPSLEHRSFIIIDKNELDQAYFLKEMESIANEYRNAFNQSPKASSIEVDVEPVLVEIEQQQETLVPFLAMRFLKKNPILLSKFHSLPVKEEQPCNTCLQPLHLFLFLLKRDMFRELEKVPEMLKHKVGGFMKNIIHSQSTISKRKSAENETNYSSAPQNRLFSRFKSLLYPTLMTLSSQDVFDVYEACMMNTMRKEGCCPFCKSLCDQPSDFHCEDKDDGVARPRLRMSVIRPTSICVTEEDEDIDETTGADFDKHLERYFSSLSNGSTKVLWFDSYRKREELQDIKYEGCGVTAITKNNQFLASMKKVSKPKTVEKLRYVNEGETRQEYLIEKRMMQTNLSSLSISRSLKVGTDIKIGFAAAHQKIKLNFEENRASKADNTEQTEYKVCEKIIVPPKTVSEIEIIAEKKVLSIPWKAEVVLDGLIPFCIETEWLDAPVICAINPAETANNTFTKYSRSAVRVFIDGLYEGIDGCDRSIITTSTPINVVRPPPSPNSLNKQFY